MINLLPDERKADIRAARTNVLLMRYTGIILIALTFVLSSLYVSYSVLQVTMSNANTLVSTNDVKADVYKDTKTQVDALSGRLTEAKTILDQEVQYSKVFVKIGQLMPTGTVLGDLTLNNSSFSGTPVSVTAYAKSTSEATLIQTQFQTSPLFSQVTIQSTNETGGIEGYPVSVLMNVVLNKAGI